jgi:hypothetical protein
MATNSYEVVVQPNAIELGLTTQNNILTVQTVDYVLSLSRTGGQGAQGYSAYEIAVQNGYTGTAQQFADELSTLAQKVTAAAASAQAAATSANAASTSANLASGSANSAAQSAVTASSQANASSQSATNAALSAAEASAFADASEDSSIDSQLSAADAAASEDAAATSEANALLYKNEAQSAATTATTGATTASAQALAASNSAASALASANNASNSEDNAADSAAQAALSATASATSATTADYSADLADLSATNADASADAAALSQADALASKNSASASATTATTKAGEALTSANTATTKATEAATSATNSATSATVSTAQASIATAKAYEAAQSAANAAASQAAAEASLASFRSTYLGELNADPTLDGNGDPVMIGAEYFNTVSNKLKVYTSTGWQFYDATAQTASQNAALSASQAAASSATAQSYSSTAILKAAEADGSAQSAAASEASALASKNAAATSEQNADESELYALNYKNAAATSADIASSKASDANTSAVNAATSATNAAGYLSSVVASANNASQSASDAATSESNAAASASAALTSANNADASEALAFDWATKTSGTVDGTNYSAKYYALQTTADAAAAALSETNAATSATSASVSASSAATSLNNIGQSESNAAASAASALASKNAAATSATNALASENAAELAETNASNSALAASNSEQNAADSAAEALASKNAAATSEANADTSEANALASANSASSSAASALSSKNAAATSETNASTSATNAATSESNALVYQTVTLGYKNQAETSATNAATSETNALISKNAAVTAQLSAEAARDAALSAYDSFDDRYLGAKLEDPFSDNDGNQLVAGMLYFQTNVGMRVYTGSFWTSAYVSGGGFMLPANNLSDVVSVQTARNNLGLGSAALLDTEDFASAAQGELIDDLVRVSGEPSGHSDITESVLSFDAPSRTFSISPVNASFEVWCKGNKHIFNTTQSVVIPNTTGTHYIYFSSAGVLSTKTTFFTFGVDTFTAYIYWNATTQQAVYFGDERHGTTLDWQTHEYLHRTRGAAFATGFAASGYTITGSGDLDSHAQLSINGGTFFDEDVQIDVVSTATPVPNTWQQDLESPARIPMLYRIGTSWVIDAPTDFPLKQGTARPQYNNFNGSGWTTTDVTNTDYTCTWILATNNLNYPVIGILSQSNIGTLNNAEAALFESLDLSGFPSLEFRPLYKLIFQGDNAYDNSVNARLRGVYDLRAIPASGGSATTPVTNHSNLSGLINDDHPQYLHIDNVRTMSSAVANSIIQQSTVAVTMDDVLAMAIALG